MDRITLCDEKMKEIFGTAANSGEGNDPELMQILQRLIFGEISYVGKLDSGLREMITVSVLGTYQCFPQLKAHLQALFHVGVSPIQAREVVYQLMPFIGCPKTLNVAAVLDEVLEEKGIALPLLTTATVTETDRLEKGAEIQNELYGDEIRQKYADLPAPFGQVIPDYLTGWCFGDFYTREGLDIRTRELLILVVLMALGCTQPLAAHVKGNLKAGNDKETILTALLCAMPYVGFPLFLQALNVVKEQL